MTNIPLFDVKADNDPELIRSAIDEVVQSGQYILGPVVTRFEELVAGYLGVEADRCVGVASGTDALVLALKALDVGPGDEVITTAFSFVATASAIVRVGAKPVFVDIGPDCNIDPDRIEEAITDRTSAILPVHLYGQPAKIGRLGDFGLPLVADAAQAFGAREDGYLVGCESERDAVFATCFSFFPTKPLGGIGDGGMAVARSSAVAEQIRLLRNQGCATKCDAELVGYNSRLDAVQAAVLSRKLPQVESERQSRQNLARRYIGYIGAATGGDSVRMPHPKLSAGSAWALFTIMVDDREALQAALKAEGIGCAVYYPKALPQMDAFTDCVIHPIPMATEAARTVLSIPCHASLTLEQQDRIIDVVSSVVSHGS